VAPAQFVAYAMILGQPPVAGAMYYDPDSADDMDDDDPDEDLDL
jgi:hypothetical protein